ncbi:MAG: DNA/RNA nuclease SfsA, partial [Clostridia bacterium]|nr:DNA/RNA nuclease SfsA [Clostridia bacterium]
MKYQNFKKATFINRPNRFIAEIEIDGKRSICHVKNTGRLKELLFSGATVLVEESDN